MSQTIVMPIDKVQYNASIPAGRFDLPAAVKAVAAKETVRQDKCQPVEDHTFFQKRLQPVTPARMPQLPQALASICRIRSA